MEDKSEENSGKIKGGKYQLKMGELNIFLCRIELCEIEKAISW